MSNHVNRRQVIKALSGNAFKVFYTLLELTVKERKKDPNHDGWVQVSYNQLRMMTGVKSIVRVVDEFMALSEGEDAIIEIDGEYGTANKYRIAKELVDERME